MLTRVCTNKKHFASLLFQPKFRPEITLTPINSTSDVGPKVSVQFMQVCMSVCRQGMHGSGPAVFSPCGAVIRLAGTAGPSYSHQLPETTFVFDVVPPATVPSLVGLAGC